MISNLNNRLSSLLPPSTISRKGALALSSSTAGVDGLRWWIDCQSNPTLQFELRLLLFLLKGHVYSGDLWRLVMARQIEVMQEERFKVYKIQPQNHTSSNHLAMELEFLEDKRDRAQLELSLYSQAMDVFQPHLGYALSLGLMGACRAISQDKWLSGMATGVSGDTGPAIGDVTDESTSVTSKLLTIYKTLVLPEIACRPYGMVSTWVEECIEEYYMDDRATEGASLQILISQASDLSNPEAEVCFLEAELSLMQSIHRRAQTEVELLSDAIQYLIESDMTLTQAIVGLTPKHISAQPFTVYSNDYPLDELGYLTTHVVKTRAHRCQAPDNDELDLPVLT
ncbi:hypothetical protein C8R48DRAFT_671339 [Suillus tomentosus]|nr:hypothetical protein C8R48DRAFT_671339 [Suillus tomentosus]